MLNERIAHILLGGHLTLKILLEQEVPQGDILSSFILIITVEIILIKITKSRDIKGIKLQTQEEIRAQTFADETSLLIQRCINSLDKTKVPLAATLILRMFYAKKYP